MTARIRLDWDFLCTLLGGDAKAVHKASTIVHIYPPLLQAVSGRGYAGCLETTVDGYYVVLSRILQMNFREFLFHVLR